MGGGSEGEKGKGANMELDPLGSQAQYFHAVGSHKPLRGGPFRSRGFVEKEMMKGAAGKETRLIKGEVGWTRGGGTGHDVGSRVPNSYGGGGMSIDNL